MLLLYLYIFFFKQKTAYEMRISDWSSDVCSSDLTAVQPAGHSPSARAVPRRRPAQRRTGTAVRRGEGGAARRGHLSPPGAIERRQICAHREEQGVYIGAVAEIGRAHV